MCHSFTDHCILDWIFSQVVQSSKPTLYAPPAGPHPETAGDLLGAAGLPGAALQRPEADGAAQLRGRLRLAAQRRGADGRGAPLLQHIEPAHGQELAALLLPVGDGRDGRRTDARAVYCGTRDCFNVQEIHLNSEIVGMGHFVQTSDSNCIDATMKL